MTDYRNITQSTYDRLLGHVADKTKPAVQDFIDLVRAYEDAVTLLDDMLFSTEDEAKNELEAEDFLYLANGEPRVTLKDEA